MADFHDIKIKSNFKSVLTLLSPVLVQGAFILFHLHFLNLDFTNLQTKSYVLKGFMSHIK